MKKNMKGSTYFIIGILILLIWIIIGVVIQKDDVIINETDTHLYVKEYKMYNVDSIINIYHKPITYNGIVYKKETRKRFVGVVGKGGHYKTYYHIIIKYGNNKTYEKEDKYLYDTYKEKENVIVKEIFYPREEIKIYKK